MREKNFPLSFILMLLLLLSGIAVAQDEEQVEPKTSGRIEYADGGQSQLEGDSGEQIYNFLHGFISGGKDGKCLMLEDDKVVVEVQLAGDLVTLIENGQKESLPVAKALEELAASKAQGMLSACCSNLLNIGTALEMWASDNGGRYPESVAQVAPKYLLQFPTCPESGTDTYSASYRRGTEPDWFQLRCDGDHSVAGKEKGLPAYTSAFGVIQSSEELEGNYKP